MPVNDFRIARFQQFVRSTPQDGVAGNNWTSCQIFLLLLLLLVVMFMLLLLLLVFLLLLLPQIKRWFHYDDSYVRPQASIEAVRGACQRDGYLFFYVNDAISEN